MLVTPQDVRVNADHLLSMSDNDIEVVINDTNELYIKDAMSAHPALEPKLLILWKYLTQHFCTLNIRRADSESIAGMSKGISVAKGEGLSQTEYGQTSKAIIKGLDIDELTCLETGDQKASIRLW
jgi:hypothetical protein